MEEGDRVGGVGEDQFYCPCDFLVVGGVGQCHMLHGAHVEELNVAFFLGSVSYVYCKVEARY